MIISYILASLVPILMIVYAWKNRHSISADVIWYFTVIITLMVTLLIILFTTNK